MDSDPLCHMYCKACLKQSTQDVESFISMDTLCNEPEFSSLNFLQLMDFLLDTTSNTEDLNHFLCSKCACQLTVAAQFKKKCKRNRETFPQQSIYKKSTPNDLEISTKCEEPANNLPNELEPPISVSNVQANKDVYCIECDTTFNSKKQYSKHRTQLHNSTLCELCGETIRKKNLLKEHMRIHTGEKPFACEFCNQSFRTVNSHKSHVMTIHTAEKRFKCQYCNKAYSNSGNMWSHIRRNHTHEPQHACSLCPKQFFTKPDLRDHMTSHTGEKNEICPICYKAFGTKQAVRTHQITHTKERNYPCPVCHKWYSLSSTLRLHMKSHPDAPKPPKGAILKVVKTLTNDLETSDF